MNIGNSIQVFLMIQEAHVITTYKRYMFKANNNDIIFNFNTNIIRFNKYLKN